MDRSRVGIVIPALNESKTLGDLIRFASNYGIPIVVDDGSKDNTRAIALDAGAIVISHEQNLGYDAALNSGFAKAFRLGFDLVITLDGDGQHDPNLIEKFIAKIDMGFDIVIGARNKKQRFSEYVFGWYTNLRYGIVDPLCGMKAYRMNVYSTLSYFDSYRSIGTELAIFAVKNNFPMSQVFFNVRDREGRSRFSSSMIGNFRILRSMLLSMGRRNQ